MTRGFVRGLARGLIGVLLMAQWAVAAYACPGLAAKVPAAATASAVSPGDAPMPECDDMVGSMDPQLPHLCAEHCKQGKQSDQASTLTVPVVMLTALYTTLPSPPGRAPARPTTATLSALVAACPPHAILHCVYRI